MYEDQNQQMIEQPPMRKSSPAKSAVAQTKPRDEHGKFLSGEELQQYNQMRQAQQMESERAKFNQILGKGGMMNQPMQNSPMQMPQEDKFRAMLRANGAGGRAVNSGTQEVSGDKWDVLLGKKRTNLRW